MAIKYGPIVYKVVNKPVYPKVIVTNSGTVDFTLVYYKRKQTK